MRTNALLRAAVAFAGMSILAIGPNFSSLTFAQDQPVAADDVAAADEVREPLDEGELDILVARIALYPDDLVALISTASLYPLQIVEAARFLESKTSPDLKPKESWDGSVISLLNYPDIVKMMSDDLDWTQAFGEAIANQQKDVLAAIQQLRDKAVANGIIKSDDKIKVVQQGDNVVIQPANPDNFYVPQYEPAMLYEPAISRRRSPTIRAPIRTTTIRRRPISRALSRARPLGPSWTGTTGESGAADWDGGDVDIDCNNCFNNGNSTARSSGTTSTGGTSIEAR